MVERRTEASAAAVAPPLPPVIGHRGAAALAPENTIAGFRRAQAAGCRWVEFDVRLTGDGALVVLHDPRLDRTTNGRGKVARLPLAEIRRYDAGGWFAPVFAEERVPTLDETLAVLAELGLGANIEMKGVRGSARATAAAVAAALACRDLARDGPPVLISSFSTEAVAAVRDFAPGLPLGVLFGAIPRHWRAIAGRLGCATVHADQRRLHARAVDAVRAAGYPLLAYTVNDPARARQLFAWGVTSVFSDAPDILLANIGEAGQGIGRNERQGVVR